MRPPIALTILLATALVAVGCGSSSSTSSTSTTVKAGRLGNALPAPTPNSTRDPKAGAYAGVYCPLTSICKPVYTAAIADAKHWCATNGQATPSSYTASNGAKYPFLCFTLAANKKDVTGVRFGTRAGGNTVLKDTVSYAYFTSVDSEHYIQPKWDPDNTHVVGRTGRISNTQFEQFQGEIYQHE
jgi:hypothetical protein